MNFFKQAVLFEGGLGVIAVAAGVFFGFPFWQRCSFIGEAFLQIAAATAATIAVYFVLGWLPFECLRKIDRIVREIVQREMSGFRLPHFVVIAAFAGFGEEFFFRGLLQDGFTEYLGVAKQIPVLIAVSLLFALAHNITRTYFVLAFLISLYFGFLLLYTENLFVPAAVHGLYDLFVLLYINRQRKPPAL
ncbi:MAG: CPBP family intramembrane metalloprotease [Planctomycetaceae bacterium]|jgi:membrane protease YdiL (CAAX protease family)|nr:CPBP family intramembrane metalloprotease [Planctomycetaceae bacterium]